MQQTQIETDQHPERVLGVIGQNPDLDAMSESAEKASEFLKSLAHKNRLLILCRLAMGPCTVTEIENLLSVKQSSVSQQLARLRQERIVRSEREGKSIVYSLADERVIRMVGLLYEMFCKESSAGE